MGLKDVIDEYQDFEVAVADELRSQRRSCGISLKEMAEKIGLHSNTIAKTERHEFKVGLDIIYGYAKVLGRPLESFFSRGRQSKTNGNPVAKLTGAEMLLYSQILQGVFAEFTRGGIKLSAELSLELTQLVASSIIEQRIQGH